MATFVVFIVSHSPRVIRGGAQRHGQIDMETHSCRARHVGLPEAYQSYLGIRAVFRDKSDGTDMLVPRVPRATCPCHVFIWVHTFTFYNAISRSFTPCAIAFRYAAFSAPFAPPP